MSGRRGSSLVGKSGKPKKWSCVVFMSGGEPLFIKPLPVLLKPRRQAAIGG